MSEMSVGWRLQIEPQLLADRSFGEDRVGLLLGLHKPERVVDPAGTGQGAVGPEHHSPVIPLLGKGDAFVDQSAAEAVAAGPILDEEEPEPGCLLGLAGAVDGARALAVYLADPGPLAFGVEVLEEL